MNNLKKALLVSFVLSLILTGCNGEERVESDPNKDVLVAVTDVSKDKNKNTSGGIDVDLTELSSTMVYGEVYNMMSIPEKYVGKTVKMSGYYNASYYEATKQYYHFVIISDATDCCAQGLEFMWTGEHTYPEDYPQNDTQIEITGVFESYKDGEQTFYRIVTNEIKILQ